MKEDFTVYDIKPEEFINYLRYYGEHFNKKLCEFACKQLPKHEYSKEKLDVLLQAHNITYMQLTGVKVCFMDQVFQMRNGLYYLLKMYLIKNLIWYLIDGMLIWLRKVSQLIGKR